MNELIAEYNALGLKRYFISEVKEVGILGKAWNVWVVTDSLNKNESIVKVYVDKQMCYQAVNKANKKYREVFYGDGSIQ